MAEELEHISQLLVRYRIFESTYRSDPQSDVGLGLQEALVRLYTEILIHLSIAVKFYRESSAARILKSLTRSVDEVRSNALKEREKEVDAFAAISNAEALRSVHTFVTRISTQVAQTLSETRFQDIVDWLRVVPYNLHHQFVTQSRLTGAGGWLLQHQTFAAWQASSSSSLLLVQGIPGSGKSTLCSVVIDFLLSLGGKASAAAPFGYFYCVNTQSEESRRLAVDVLRTILFQLAIDQSQTPATAIRDFLSVEHKRQAALSKAGKYGMAELCLQDCVRLILELAEQDPMTIVIDGLDSVEESEIPALVQSLREIVSAADNVVKIFVTSRITSRSALKPTAEFQIQITAEETQREMEAFVNDLVERAVKEKRLLDGNVSSDTKSLVTKSLLSGSHEMFLWPRLQLQRACREAVEEDFLTVLRDTIPLDLDRLYQRSLDYIFGFGKVARGIATKLISCLLHMREPLRPMALLMALAEGKDSKPDLQEVLIICDDLVVLDAECGMLRFAHQSVQDFLNQKEEEFAFATVHCTLATLCVDACLRGPDPATINDLRIPSDDFYVYAAMYWPVHSTLALTIDRETYADHNLELVHRIMDFIFQDWDTTLSFESWVDNVRKIASLLPRDHAMKLSMGAIASSKFAFVFPLTIFGLGEALRAALTKIDDVDLNVQNELGHTPIYLAAAYGQSEILSLWAERGADVNVECGKYGSPLHVACFSGHLEVVKRLLTYGAKVECGSTFRTAFEAACQGRQQEVAKYLLQEGVVVSNEVEYETALGNAALVGFREVVRALEDPQFAAFSTNKNQTSRGKLKIRNAIQGGHTWCLEPFVGDNPGARDIFPQDAVALATLFNHKSTVEFLLDHGMDIEAAGDFGSPLRIASLLNFFSIVRLLLDRGANVGACGPFGDSLQAAALAGNVSIIRLLIQRNAPVNQKTGFYGSALQAAAFHGHIDAVEVLLDASASVTQGGICSDAFQAAYKGGHESVVKLMQRRGYSPFERFQCLMNGGGFSGRVITIPPMVSRFKVFLAEPFSERLKSSSLSTSAQHHYIDNISIAQWPAQEMEILFRGAMSRMDAVEQEAEGSSTAYSSHRGRHSSAMFQPAIVEAATSGDQDTIASLLSDQYSGKIAANDLTSAFHYAASNSHFSILSSLVDFAVNRQNSKDSNQFPYLDLSYHLERISEHLSGSQYTALRQKIVNAEEKYQEAEVSKETLLLDFALSCKTGDQELAAAIFSKDHHRILSRDEIECGLQLCAFFGHSLVAQTLLNFSSLPDCPSIPAEDAFVAAAANGHLSIVRLLNVHSSGAMQSLETGTIQRALIMASKGGHIGVVHYLVTELHAKVNLHTLDDEPNLKIRPNHNLLGFHAGDSHPFLTVNYRSQPQPQMNRDNGEPLPIISPLQAALQGFASQFGALVGSFPAHSLGPPYREIQWRNGTQSQYQDTIKFLLEKGSRVDDLAGQRMFPIQMAAKYCPEIIVSCMTAAGAELEVEGCGQPELREKDNLNDRDWRQLCFNSTKKPLFEAAGRELSSFSLVSLLVSAGAQLPMENDSQLQLIGQGLRYFEGGVPRGFVRNDLQDLNGSSLLWKNVEDPDGRFVLAPSLEYVFAEGPGAVLEFLLCKMPEFRTTDVRWALVLQMCAFTNQLDFVDLLLSRGTDVNATGYYYGTALQAAARRGHVTMTQKLLDAGAEVNIEGGRWGRALNASLVDGHEIIMHALLDRGAEPSSDVTKGVLRLAVGTSNLAIVGVLLKTRKLSPGDWELQDALLLAARNGDVNIAAELIEAGALVNAYPLSDNSNRNNTSPIHEASERGQVELIELLIANGADPNLIIHSKTPLEIAASRGNAEAVRCLLSAGARADCWLWDIIRNQDFDVAYELLAGGADAFKLLDIACSMRKFDMFDILVDAALKSNPPNLILDKVFSVEDVDDLIVQLLLSYDSLAKSVTKEHFLQLCAQGFAASVDTILRQGFIDIGEPAGATGDYPLQVAAFNLQLEVVQTLLARGASTECQSISRGPPLVIALEACVALRLKHRASDRICHIVDKLVPPKNAGLVHIDFRMSSRRNPKHRRISECQAIVELLVHHGASIEARGILGPPLHLACLIGCSSLVSFLLNESQSCFDETVGYFEKPLFAALEGQDKETILTILRHLPHDDHVHSEFGTALQVACSFRSGHLARALLEFGVDAIAEDSPNQTPLAVALQTEVRLENRTRRWRSHDPDETALEAVMKLLRPLAISDHDIATAANLERASTSRNRDVLRQLLQLSGELIIQETTICQALRTGSLGQDIIMLLLERCDCRSATEKMIQAVQDEQDLAALLAFQPPAKMSSETLTSQSRILCMEMLLDYSQEIPITGEVLIRALELKKELDGRLHENGGSKTPRSTMPPRRELHTGAAPSNDVNSHKNISGSADAATPSGTEERSLVLTLLQRNGDISITQEMLKLVCSAEDTKLLLQRLDPTARISKDVLRVVCDLANDERLAIMRQLIEHDVSLRVDPELALQILDGNDTIVTLEMLLEHDTLFIVTSEMFLGLIGQESSMRACVELLERHKKKIAFTEAIRRKIDQKEREWANFRVEKEDIDRAAELKRRIYDLSLEDNGPGALEP